MISRVQTSKGYTTPHMDIHGYPCGYPCGYSFWFLNKITDIWISWISIWISTGICILISGHPFGYPILILDIQYDFWISKPISTSNLWISTLDIQCYPYWFWIFFWISSSFFRIFDFWIAAPPVGLLCCLSATFSRSQSVLSAVPVVASLSLLTFIGIKKSCSLSAQRASPGAHCRGTAREKTALLQCY